MPITAIGRPLLALAAVLLLLPGPRAAFSHPHLTPEQIQARIQELDALLPVVKRMRVELLVERAALNTRLDRLAEALLDCRRASFRDPASPRPHRQAGEMLEVRGAYRLASAEYERALRLARPEEVTCWRLGNCYREQKRFAEAEAMFRKASGLAVDPLAKAARRVDVARTAELSGDLAAAEAALTESVRLSDGWPSYLQARAELHMRTKAFAKAAADFAAIVAKATDGADEFPMMVRRADALAAAGEASAARAAYEQAEKVISRLLSEDPAFVEDLHYWRGRARRELGRLDGALADAREALVGLPDQIEYLELMVKIGEKKGATPETRRAARDLAEARAFTEKSRRQFETVQGEMREKVRKALEQANAEALAEAMLEKGLKRLRTDEAAGRKMLDLAVRKFDELGRAHADRAAAYLRHRARAKLAVGEAEAALRLVEQCLKAEPENARYRRLRMRVARALLREEVAKKDEAFLEALIQRSQDEDLLQPDPSGGAKRGGDGR